MLNRPEITWLSAGKNKTTKNNSLGLLDSYSRAEQIHSCYQWLRSVCKPFALNSQLPNFHIHKDVNTFAAATLIVKFSGNFPGVKHKLSALKQVLPLKTMPMAMGEALFL